MQVGNICKSKPAHLTPALLFLLRAVNWLTQEAPRYGATAEDFAEIGRISHEHSQRNPYAQFRQKLLSPGGPGFAQHLCSLDETPM